MDTKEEVPLRPAAKRAAKALDRYFVSEPESPRTQEPLLAVKFTLLDRGKPCLVKLPFKKNTPDFVLACRNIGFFADEFQVTCLFFGADEDFEALRLDQNTCARLGLKPV